LNSKQQNKTNEIRVLPEVKGRPSHLSLNANSEMQSVGSLKDLPRGSAEKNLEKTRNKSNEVLI
jgi:hypothetical protein